jgi:C-terminal processing protease CtpA/Prc
LADISVKKEELMTTTNMKPDLGAVQTLPEFLKTTGVLTRDDMVGIVSQALVLIDDLYAHLPLKKAMHAVDPVQRLKLLRRRIGGISERSFHSEMISIFVELRDLHTNYLLPQPYNDKTAFLPFLIEEYFEGNTRHYIVSKLIAGFAHEAFKPGVEVTHWSGVPIETAVANNADREAGSNEFARHVRGLDRMTIRPMRMSLPPDEEWVIVGCTDGADAFEIRLPWQVFSPDPDPHAIAIESPVMDPGVRASQGVDLLTEMTNRTRKILFAPDAMEAERKAENLRANGDVTPEIVKKALGDVSTMPEVFQFRTVDTPVGQFGYVRIRTFRPGPEVFIQELIRILGLMPQNGLVIDVRGNGGGTIMSGERMLQLFTPNRVIAGRLQFINTEQTLALSKTTKFEGFLRRWQPSIELSLFTGAVYSQGFPIEDPDLTNAIGQKYQGKVVLITDARCYSTTDIFAAGFQDNKIGVILGVDGNTGAGGANVFTHELLDFLFSEAGSPIKPLPNGASMRVAIRRTTRVGDSAGLPVEDVGVTPDRIHKITRKDLLDGNVDLIKSAAAILAEG